MPGAKNTDIYTPEKRSAIMSKVKAANTAPERLLRRELHHLGFRFRLKSGHLPGGPDIVLNKYKTVVFVHGCFWHRHSDCRKTTVPMKNRSFWKQKFAINVARDAKAAVCLQSLGWKVLVAWECEIMKQASVVAMSISNQLLLCLTKHPQRQVGTITRKAKTSIDTVVARES